jgi:GNAT superfamily N-acetyltransferase
VRELGPGKEQVLDAVDGRRHVALVAVADGEPIGIAQCIGLGSGRAEPAVEVVDAWHGRGVGTLLLRARAVAAGWRELSAEVLAENDAVRALLRKVFPIQGVERDGAELSLTLPLVDPWSVDAADLLTGSAA